MYQLCPDNLLVISANLPDGGEGLATTQLVLSTRKTSKRKLQV